MDNQEWTIQKYWQHWVPKTQDEDKQNKKNPTQKIKKMGITDPTKLKMSWRT
jgi:hypothetical protein